MNSLFKLLLRNNYSREGTKSVKGKVNLEYFRDAVNLGDYLSLVICQRMLELHKLSFDSNSVDGKTKHMMAVGGRGEFDATVWGSGIRSISSIRNIAIRKFYKKLDIRAARGPLTREALLSCGYKCPEVYGDPAVLMPMIYSPNTESKRGTVLITHYSTEQKAFHKMENIILLDIKTKDYKKFIDSIASIAHG